MKKILFMAMALFAGATASFAQLGTPVDHTFEFVDTTGTLVPDGSIINVTQVEDSHGLLLMNSGLFVNNTTGKVAYGSMQFIIESMPNGEIQHCWPGICNYYGQDYIEQKGNIVLRDPARVDANVTKQSIQSEWSPEEGQYGTCTVSYQFKVYTIDKDFNYTPKGDGPKVTVNYIYSNPNGINSNVASKQLKSIAYFDLSGREVKNPVQGVFVKKLVYADGTTRTVKEYKK